MVASSEFWDDGKIIEIEVPDDSVQTAPISRLEPREFLNDEIYFEYYLRFKKKTEEAQARARAAKEQALRQNAAFQPPSAAPAPSPASQEPAPAKKRNKGALVISETFVGDSFPILNLTTMPPIKYEVIHDSESLKKAVAALSKEKIIAVDTETTGLDPYTSKLILVQVASPQICYIMDHQKLDIAPMKQVLEDERIIKILQNAKFDYEMLLIQAGIELNNVYDTMLAERLLTAGLKTEVNLAALTKKYLNEIMDKSVRKTFYGATANHGPLTPQQLEYAAKDALALFPIYTKQLIDLKEKKLLAVADLEFKCVMAVADLELAGCKLDTVKWRQILAGVTIKRDEARNAVMELLPNGKARQVSMFGGDEYLINLNSGSQIKAEFERMGIKLEDTSEATLSKFSDNVAIKKLLEYRSHEKTLGTFGEGLLAQINPKTNRIHPDFIQYGADTGRFSCSNPNVQQIPATSDFRACFIPEEGYKLVTCDYSQCIARDSWITLANGSFILIQDHPATISRGLANTVAITTSNGYKLECTTDHQLLTQRGWQKASELQADDYLALQGQIQSLPTAFNATEWLRGFYAGNMIDLAKITNLASFLLGLFDAKTSFDKTTLVFSTSQAKPAYDLQVALLNFGIMASLTKQTAGYQVHIKEAVATFNKALTTQAVVKKTQITQLHAVATLEDDRYQWDKLAKIEDSGREIEVFDLLDQPENRFVASGFVVHNCELRVLAELSGDEAFLGAFKSGGDLHILAASQMFNIPPEEVTKSQRGQAKAINFGLAYGMGPQGLALRIDKTVEESRELISAYFRAFSGVQQWLDKAGRDSVRLGYSPTPLGRKRFYHKPTSDDPDYRKKMSEIERQGKNAPIQGCVSGSTRIFEKNSGYVKIEQLVGQTVTIWDGEQFAHAGVVFSGQKQLVKVHSVGGHYIECSPEHRFLMADKTWKRAEELKAQDCIVLTNEIDENWEIASKEADPKLSLPELMVRTPESIWRNSKFLAAYLRGIFDRMGKVHSYGVTLTFAQWQGRLTWIKEIQQALLLFGIGSRINITDEKVTVTVPSRETYLLKSKIGYKLASGKIPKNSGELRSEEIATIEITDTFVDMYDVVNSATERFMANGIIVHNCNADMTKMALIFIRNELKAKKYDARMVNTVHDEIVVEVIEAQAQEVCEMVEAAMIRAGREILKEVPIVADAKIGDYWSK